MNLNEYSKCLKSKVATIITNWDKLTIRQLEEIERIINIISQPTEEETPLQNGNGYKRRRNLMNDTIYGDMKYLRSLGWSWDRIAKKYGYKNAMSASVACSVYKRRNPCVDKQ